MLTADPAAELSRAAEELASAYISAAVAARQAREPQVEPLEPAHGTDSLWAVDGSHTFLLGLGGSYLAWVRAVALRYELGADGGLSLRDIRVHQAPNTFDHVQPRDEEAPRGRRVSEMADHLRHGMELALAGEVSREVRGGLVALDGALAAPPSGELSGLLRDAAEACAARGAVLVGVSKDSAIRALGAGMADEEALRLLGHRGAGFVRLPGLSERGRPPVLGDSYFARLHPAAGKWFRVDIASPGAPGPTLGRLARFAAAGPCPGYPLPLLEAHRTAVLARQMQPQLRELALRAAARAGIPLDDLTSALTDAEGRRAGEFHALLDEFAKVGK